MKFFADRTFFRCLAIPLHSSIKENSGKEKMTDGNKYTEYVISREDITYAVEFCNIETAYQLLAVGTELRVSIYQCKFKVKYRCHQFSRLRSFLGYFIHVFQINFF